MPRLLYPSKALEEWVEVDVFAISDEEGRRYTAKDIEDHIKTEASTEQHGHVKLNDTLTSTSKTEAATADAVRRVSVKVDNAVPKDHKHSAADITSGVMNVNRLPSATTSAKGVVQLINSVGSTSTTLAPTASAVRTAYNNAEDAKKKVDKVATLKRDRENSLIYYDYNGSSFNGRDSIMYKHLIVLEGVISEGGLLYISGYQGASQYGTALGIPHGTGDKLGDYSTRIGAGSWSSGQYSAAIGAFTRAFNEREGVIGNEYDSSTHTRTDRWVIPGSLSVRGSKNFEIPHPAPKKRDTHIIRHGAVESPTAGDTLYRYFVTFENKIAKVKFVGEENIISSEVEEVRHEDENVYKIKIKLPDYWIHLNKDHQVTVSSNMHFKNGTGYIDKENETLVLLLQALKPYDVVLYGTRNDEDVQQWQIKGVEREIGESWLGETYTSTDNEVVMENEFLRDIELFEEGV